MIRNIIIAILMAILLVRYTFDWIEYVSSINNNVKFKNKWRLYVTPYVFLTLLAMLVSLIAYAIDNEYVTVESENHDLVGCVKVFGPGSIRFNADDGEWCGRRIEKALGVPVENWRTNYPISKGEMVRLHGKIEKVDRGIYRFVN